jgi:catechol 2,3-dioxygenase-like lactoylglutathione lyase family enzyme
MFSRGAPSIFVADLDRALRFYRDVLGFALECVDEPPVRAVVTNGSAVLHLDRRPEKAGSSVTHMMVDNLDEVCGRLARGHAGLIQPPTVQPWGLRDIAVADPDGNVLELAEPVRKSASA